jgi:hypothetical protein
VGPWVVRQAEAMRLHLGCKHDAGDLARLQCATKEAPIKVGDDEHIRESGEPQPRHGFRRFASRSNSSP